MSYPAHHRHIVQHLLDGEFLLYSHQPACFGSLKANESFYQAFFQQGFGFTLECQSDYAYLSSTYANNKWMPRISCFFAACARQLHTRGHSLQQLEEKRFTLQELDELFTSWMTAHGKHFHREELATAEQRTSLYKHMAKKRVLHAERGYYRFTAAYKAFVDFFESQPLPAVEPQPSEAASEAGLDSAAKA